jgi:integral membrane protein
MSPVLRTFRLVALLEGSSLLLLYFVAMPLKYGLGIPQAVSIVGTAHGLLFVVFVLALAVVHLKEKWPLWKSGLAFLMANVPFGTFWFERKYLRD